MSDTSPEPEDVAGELALGVLDDVERAAAERRRLTDPRFAAEVEAWELRLARLSHDETEPREPRVDLWSRIARAVQAQEAGKTLVRLRRALAIWRGAAAASSAVAAALMVALAWPRPAPPPAATPPQPSIEAAQLAAASDGQVAFVAVLDPARRELVLTPAAVTTATGKSPQLWVIPAHGRPVSVGVATFGAPVRLSVDALVGGHAGRTLAVSLEPAGGSPTGQPTGPVIATGELKAL